MPSSSSASSDIDDLADALCQLSLAQSRVDGVLQRLRSRSTIPVAVTVDSLPVARVSPIRARARPRSHVDDFSIGDRVHIKRPSRLQQGAGVIIDFTPTGFLQIRTPDQSVVLRQPANVTFIGSSP